MPKPSTEAWNVEALNGLPWRQFDAVVAQHLDFTRDHVRIWRALTHIEAIDRTKNTLERLRAALETSVANGKLAENEATNRQRDLLHCRQEEIRTALRYQYRIDEARSRANNYSRAIRDHQQASQNATLVPEAHDEALWATLPKRLRVRSRTPSHPEVPAN
jgi:hypothetical protein